MRFKVLLTVLQWPGLGLIVVSVMAKQLPALLHSRKRNGAAKDDEGLG